MIEEMANGLCLVAIFWNQPDQTRSDVSNACGYCLEHSLLTWYFWESHTWSAKDTNELAGGASIVRDRNHISESGIVRLSNVVEDIDEIIGRAASREDDNAIACRR